MKGKGPKAAFDALESKLPALKGRRFFGTVQMVDEDVVYYACVERLPTEDPVALGLDAGAIPGGKYVRRRVFDWESVVAAGKMKQIGDEFAQDYILDPGRPTIEFYRSMKELHILLPLADPSVTTSG
jgi:hypothetical protein